MHKDDLIHEIFKGIMDAVNETFEEIEERGYNDDDDDDLIPEEKITVDLLETKIRDAVSYIIEDLIENEELRLD